MDAVATTTKAASPVVRLNVGGHLYQTTRNTLTRQGEHMLSAMFSGRVGSPPVDADGFVTIDRDGQQFGLILNWLRDGAVALPASWEQRESLLVEARFYALKPLVDQLELSLRRALSLSCTIGTITSASEEARIIAQSRYGKPVVKFVYCRSNNKYSYTEPSQDAMLKNIELFDKISRKFCHRVTFVKDTSGRNGHICAWFIYGRGELISEVCCTSMVYSAEKTQTKIEFPDSRIYEAVMNGFLHEYDHPSAQIGGGATFSDDDDSPCASSGDRGDRSAALTDRQLSIAARASSPPRL